jgi:hypothetical protein
VTRPAPPSRSSPLALGAWFGALLAAPLFAGGLLVLRVLDRLPSGSRAALLALALCLGAAATLLLAGLRLRPRGGRRLALATAYLALLAIVTVAGSEGLATPFAPPWPALGLHGVAPGAGARAWGRAAGQAGAVGFNSWGQRDRERERRPRPGVRRIAFVGDSLLEESSSVPVSLATERVLARADLEILNLGVSATQPDEYYYRTRSIALPLGASHCVLFLYEGNDLSQGREITLPSFLGVAAVYPRESVLSLLRLFALNHAATNRFRPVVRIWGQAGELHQLEQALGLRIARTNDDQMPALLASLVRRADRERVVALLRSRDLRDFYAMLRQPDQGLFRSYYLYAALKALAAGERRRDVTPAYAYRWVRRTRDLLQGRGIRFTLVIVPEAFQVDERMREQWLPLVDMRELLAPERAAAGDLARVCRGDGMDVLDLHEPLAGLAGTYLNLDGHWSARGVDVVSQALARHLGSR